MINGKFFAVQADLIISVDCCLSDAPDSPNALGAGASD